MYTTLLRTAGVWIAEGQVMLESLVGCDLWGIPGGGLEPGESAEEGCVREYREETGLEMQCDALALVTENFWTKDGMRIREYAFYFLVHPRDVPGDRVVPVTSRELQLKFQWFNLDEVSALPFVPAFLPPLIRGLTPATRFISNRE